MSENSRLALNLLTGNNNECKWNSVTKRKQKSKMDTPCSEKLLIEDDLSNKDNKDVEELEDEITLLGGKNSGHRRIDPQTVAESKTSSMNIKCSECSYELESQGLLDAHMENHQIHKPEFSCEKESGIRFS